MNIFLITISIYFNSCHVLHVPNKAQVNYIVLSDFTILASTVMLCVLLS